jgi:2-polyprenyl-6-methoxyphenol hydroxylase-like FAD-dependent oxidoreductase
VASPDEEYPVLIAGGGLVGLSTAMFLAQHGIPSLAVERLRGGSPVPRAAHFHLRTLELFRQAGIEAEVKRQSEAEFLPEGAIIAMDCLAGRKLADIIGSLNSGVEALSPCRRLFITQPGLEPILRRRAEALHPDVRVLEGHEVVDLVQDAEGVTATIRDMDSGQQQTLRSKYLIGADGAHSRVRELLGIALDGRGIFSNSITIYFEADLWPQMGDKPISVIYINNPRFGGFFRLSKDCQSGFLVVNTVGDPKTNPDAANAAKDTSEQQLVEFVRIGGGVPDLDVKITGLARWRASSDVARRYQIGRVFLAGDAAHLMPPNGGFGGNTGIHDAHNLAWKLAYVLNGMADARLLETYETERRPVGRFTVEQAYTRYVTRTATYLGATDFEPLAPDFNVELGFLYRSPAVVVDEDDDAAVHADPHTTRGRPGSRAPHVWLERSGQRISSLDLFGRQYALLTGSSGGAWCAASNGLEPYRVGVDLIESEARFGEAFGVADSGAVLVRPDGFVAWRAHALVDDPAGAIRNVLRSVTLS